MYTIILGTRFTSVAETWAREVILFPAETLSYDWLAIDASVPVGIHVEDTGKRTAGQLIAPQQERRRSAECGVYVRGIRSTEHIIVEEYGVRTGLLPAFYTYLINRRLRGSTDMLAGNFPFEPRRDW